MASKSLLTPFFLVAALAAVFFAADKIAPGRNVELSPGTAVESATIPPSGRQWARSLLGEQVAPAAAPQRVVTKQQSAKNPITAFNSRVRNALADPLGYIAETSFGAISDAMSKQKDVVAVSHIAKGIDCGGSTIPPPHVRGPTFGALCCDDDADEEPGKAPSDDDILDACFDDHGNITEPAIPGACTGVCVCTETFCHDPYKCNCSSVTNPDGSVDQECETCCEWEDCHFRKHVVDTWSCKNQCETQFGPGTPHLWDQISGICGCEPGGDPLLTPTCHDSDADGIYDACVIGGSSGIFCNDVAECPVETHLACNALLLACVVVAGPGPDLCVNAEDCQKACPPLFVCPVPGGKPTDLFKQRNNRCFLNEHFGSDLAAPLGTPVQTIASGTVIDITTGSVLSDACPNGKPNLKYNSPPVMYGTSVLIQHSCGFAARFWHLSGIAPGISVGSSVSPGQVVGYVGNTGLSCGPHLHTELTKGATQVDPGEYIACIPDSPCG